MKIFVATTLKTTKQIALIFIALFFTLICSAQEKDFGLWYSVDLSHKINKKFVVELAPNFRTHENASELYKWFIESSLTYKPLKKLSLGASYRLNRALENDDNFYFSHTWMIDAKVSHSINDITLQFRTRFRQDIYTYIESSEDKKPENQIRTRLKADYDIPSCKITPYLAGELFFPFDGDDSNRTKTCRLFCGAEIKITDRQSFTVEYLNERRLSTDKQENIVSLGYAFEF